MSKDKRNVYTGAIEKDEQGNFFCGPYLLDYKYTVENFKLGDVVNIKTIIDNPSHMSREKYPKKSRVFFINRD